MNKKLIAEARDLAEELERPVTSGILTDLADALEAAEAKLEAAEDDENPRRISARSWRSIVERAEAAEAKLAKVRECIVAVQNSPGLGDTGHHRRWLRMAVSVIDGEASGESDDEA